MSACERITWDTGGEEIVKRALRPVDWSNLRPANWSSVWNHWRHSVDPVTWALEKLGRDGLGFDSFAPWQEAVLRCRDQRVALNCSRQSGKSTVTAISACHVAIFEDKSLQIIISPSGRQSKELLLKVRSFLQAIPEVELVADSKSELVLRNGSRIVSLPASSGTIRGYSKPRRIMFDEAAFAEDELYDALNPMLLRSGLRGSMWLLSTPFGQRGFFWKAMTKDGFWTKFNVPITEVPGISRSYLQQQLEALGRLVFESEYLCKFVATDGSLFDVEKLKSCITDDVPLWFPETKVQTSSLDDLLSDVEKWNV